MPLELSRWANGHGLRADVVRRWSFKEHEVALVDLCRDVEPDEPARYLLCECDTDDREDRPDPEACEAKAVIRDVARMEAKRMHGDAWRAVALKDAVLDIFTKWRAGEYMGQHRPDSLYVQDVAALLDADARRIRDACDALFAEEKLEPYYSLLIPYVARFRFPKELQGVIRRLIEDPLGYPNGEAGDCALVEIESAIGDHTHYKHGRDLVWPHNYPHLQSSALAEHGLSWIALAVRRTEEDPLANADMAWLDRDALARNLETLAARIRALTVSRPGGTDDDPPPSPPDPDGGAPEDGET